MHRIYARKLTREVQQRTTIGKAVVLAGWGDTDPKSRPDCGVDFTGIRNWKKKKLGAVCSAVAKERAALSLNGRGEEELVGLCHGL